jgi:GDPmannose 4,6-dehydratase
MKKALIKCDTPADFVIGTGITHSVCEFCEIAFGYVSLNYCDYIVEDPQFYRPAEVDLLISDPTKAHRKLGWQPSVGFEELIYSMVDADLERVSQDLYRNPPANSKVNKTLTKMT